MPKILLFFDRILLYCPYIKYYNFIIKTFNTFPHSSGLASSASFMSSLALCIIEMENKCVFSYKKNIFNNLKKASFIARLGSGSACRSIYPGFSVWGYHKSIKGSNNLYSIKYPYKIHSIYKNIMDTILIIEKNPKHISSTEGHELMNNNPYTKGRIIQANKNMNNIINILKEGNFKKFGYIIENEALSLHAMIMSSTPYYLYITPNTLNIIYKIWDFRKKSNKNIYFTLDAGANIHLLYPFKEKKIILKWIYNNLFSLCKEIIISYSC